MAIDQILDELDRLPSAVEAREETARELRLERDHAEVARLARQQSGLRREFPEVGEVAALHRALHAARTAVPARPAKAPRCCRAWSSAGAAETG